MLTRIFQKLSAIARKAPVLSFVYAALRKAYIRYQLKSKTAREIFTTIYEGNAWGGKESVSGRGSDVDQTRIITKELSSLFDACNISTVLDIPCGDFFWMKNVDLRNVDYTGADIVEELTRKNTETYGRDGIRFRCMNLIEDKLPKVDLILCRDCLVHLSFADIFLALGNVCSSQSEFFLTTTHTGRKENKDILTGQWRPLNLEIAPFMLPKPLELVIEDCPAGDGAYQDKALGLWRISNIRECLSERFA